MCESAVYLVKGNEKTLIMLEAAKVLVTPEGVECVDLLGERRTVPGAVVAEADLMRHEITLRAREG